MTPKELENFTKTNQSIYGNKCIVCGREMRPEDDSNDWNYSKTKKNVVFICNKCLRSENRRKEV